MDLKERINQITMETSGLKINENLSGRISFDVNNVSYNLRGSYDLFSTFVWSDPNLVVVGNS